MERIFAEYNHSKKRNYLGMLTFYESERAYLFNLNHIAKKKIKCVNCNPSFINIFTDDKDNKKSRNSTDDCFYSSELSIFLFKRLEFLTLFYAKTVFKNRKDNITLIIFKDVLQTIRLKCVAY
ncbi:hypothetical protein CDIK_1711 [Cucumispora dikerogammari]|nr:hypothetical protein CDIK_1711 [Cucumispora dikerogammari]